jgi:NAD(P)-dependent dehydrogenase (short-subunit alcohol dehydrogenase family)
MSVFRDKVALVTGGASGIGRAIGRALAAQGARVVLADIRCDGLEGVCQTIAEHGGQARWVQLDVSDRAAVQAAVDDVYATEGPIDYLFNNAGVCLFGEVREMTAAQWDRLIDVNIRGVVHGVEAVYPRMVNRGSGHIVNTASVVGLIPQAGSTAYSMTKHAVVGLSESLRGEASLHGVRVSVVCPGIIDTDLKNTVDLLSLDRDKLLALPSAGMMSAERCATLTLRGVRWNRGVVQVTAQTRLSWWLYRLAPDIFVSWLGPLWMRFIKARFAVAEAR